MKRIGILLGLSSSIVPCFGAPPPPTELVEASGRIKAAASLTLRDATGKFQKPLEIGGEAKAALFFFVLHDCPKANALAPEIARLAAAARERGVRPFVVYAEPDFELAAAAIHAREYAYGCPALLDWNLQLARAVGASSSPEAAIVLADGSVAYRGAVDDRTSPDGVSRPSPERRYLRDALEAIASGKPVAEPLTRAVGCRLPDPPPYNGFEALIPPPPRKEDTSPLPGTVTFNEHIAPILYQACVTCHWPGEVGPFPLISYEDVKKRSRQIHEVIASHRMPPWPVEPDMPRLLWDRGLTPRDIALIERWRAGGAPEGDPARALPPPEFPEGWRLGKPSVEVAMPAAYEVPAEGPDIYRNFVLPLGLTEDQWVRGIELQPSARKVVHHVLVFIDDTGLAEQMDRNDPEPGYPGVGAQGLKFIAAWAPGTGPLVLPKDLAWRFPRNTCLVLQTHIHPSGKAELETTRAAVHFAAAPPIKTHTIIQLPPVFSLLEGLEIPAGEKAYTLRDSFTLPVDVDAYGIGGHAHYLGKRLSMTAFLPDGTKRVLLDISRWDFAWQNQYAYRERIHLPAGTRIDSEIIWDNSADNPQNPTRPPATVRWGQQSLQEMGGVLVGVAMPDEETFAKLRKALAVHISDHLISAVLRGKSIPYRLNRSLPKSEQLLNEYDKDKDGVLSEVERVPVLERVMAGPVPKILQSSSP